MRKTNGSITFDGIENYHSRFMGNKFSPKMLTVKILDIPDGITHNDFLKPFQKILPKGYEVVMRRSILIGIDKKTNKVVFEFNHAFNELTVFKESKREDIGLLDKLLK